MSVYGCGPTAVGSRASWGPMAPAPAADKPFHHHRPLSGNFDRIFNVFERSNAFEYVKSTETCNGGDTQRRIGHTDVVTSNRTDTQERVRTVGRLDTILKKNGVVDKKHNNVNDIDNDKARAGSVPKSDGTAQSDTEAKSDNETTEKCNAVVRSDSKTLVRSDTVTKIEPSSWTGSSLERADCALAAFSPADDEDFYREKILYSQARQLFPLQEDLADWINKTIGITYLTGENFLEVLDNGVELCQLAAVIQERAREALREGTYLGPVPQLRGRCWERAARRSFFSRDNTENFITFCRELGVHENLLFESDDLVLHHQPRQVIVCLLELARIAARLGLPPPGLVQLEREIAQEEHDSALADRTLWQFREETPPPHHKSIEAAQDQNESGVCVADDADAESTKSEGTVGSTDSDVPLRPTNELDKRVQLVTRLMERGCRCGEGRCNKMLKVKKVGEGRYNIAGRNVFIRLLKGRHMMVRVGGGWDTLEHFLSRHEPCQVRLVTPRSKELVPLGAASPPPAAAPPTPTNTPPPTTRSPSPPRTPSRTSSTSGSMSPPHSRRTSTPLRGEARANRIGLTLPLRPDSVDHDAHKPTGRKSSVGSAGTPATSVTPTSRSGRATPTAAARSPRATPPARTGRPSPADFRKSHTTSSLDVPMKARGATASAKEGAFCGTERLNRARQKSASAATTPVEPAARSLRSQSALSVAVEPRRAPPAGKKGRSMSLAQAVPFRPVGRAASAHAVSVTPVSGLTQADIEESIRRSLAASLADCPAPAKQFLHIKAKYRSPPPRDVPHR